MNASIRSKFVLPLVSALAMFALSAHAEDASQPPPGPAQRPASKAAVQTPKQGHAGQGAGQPQSARVARGAMPVRNYGGQAYRGRVDWQGGRWHHEVHDGRDGYWWDVGGAWYYYPEPMEGPPNYISEDYVDDVGPPVAYAPPPGAYAPPPPPPPPDPGASAVGGAIVGGLLGGLLTGRASGAAIGAVAGGATGAVAGATAASQPGYYLAQGNCYYRYPSGQYVQADPRACY
jgi:hypothetical protein